MTDTDVPTPTLVPLIVELQHATQTVFLTATTSTDERAGQFTGSMLVHSGLLGASLLEHSNPITWGQEVRLIYQDSLPEENVTTRVHMPAPDFVDPTPPEGQVLSTAENCPLVQLLKVDDPNGFQVEMVPSRFWSDHDWHGVGVHDVLLRQQPCLVTLAGAWECKAQGTSDYPAGHGLMPGASLQNITSSIEVEQIFGGLCPEQREVSTRCGALRHGIQTAVFSWTARPQDQGRVWTQCLTSRQVDGAVQVCVCV